MTDDEHPAHGSRPHDGAMTAEEGTPVAVDVSRDLRARRLWLMFLAGPLIWFGHFVIVYGVVEAGCTGEGPGLRLLDPPVPAVVTLAATAVAALACLGAAWWGHQRWRARPAGDAADRAPDADLAHAGASLGFTGMLLSLLSCFAVLIVGLPALVLPSC